jgi:hypothetical protein
MTCQPLPLASSPSTPGGIEELLAILRESTELIDELTKASRLKINLEGQQHVSSILETRGYPKRSLEISRLASLLYLHSRNDMERIQKYNTGYVWNSFPKGFSPDTFNRWSKGESTDREAHICFCAVVQYLGSVKCRFDPVRATKVPIEHVDDHCLNRTSQDHARLETNMICRLMTASHTDEGLQQMSILYGHQCAEYNRNLHLKNNALDDFFKAPPTIVKQEAFVESVSSKLAHGLIEISFYVDVHDEQTKEKHRLQWGKAAFSKASGNAELLLDSRPAMWAGRIAKINNQPVAHLKGETLSGERLSFTEYAINKLEEISLEEGCFAPLNMGGFLKDSNWTKFRHYWKKSVEEYPDWSDEQRTFAAFYETPFGRARKTLGFSEIEILILSRDNWDLPDQIYVRRCYRSDQTN